MLLDGLFWSIRCTAAAQGCVLSSATLRLFAGSAQTGRTLHALRLASAWTETATLVLRYTAAGG